MDEDVKSQADGTPAEKPKPRLTAAELAEHRKQLVLAAEKIWEEQDRAETKALLAQVQETAQRIVAEFATLPCEGAVANVHRCSNDFAAQCSYNATPSCPRRIIAHDESQRAAELEERLTLSGIPRQLQQYTESPEATPARVAVDAWLKGRSVMLVLSGGVGVGKSVAAAYAIRRTPGRWLQASEWKELQGYQHEERRASLRKTPLLVVDDLGTSDSQHGVEDLINRRYDDGARTIITTNLDGAALKRIYTERFIDRIIGADGLVSIAGESFRRRRPAVKQ